MMKSVLLTLSLSLLFVIQPEISLSQSPSCLRERSVSAVDKYMYTWVPSAYTWLSNLRLWISELNGVVYRINSNFDIVTSFLHFNIYLIISTNWSVINNMSSCITSTVMAALKMSNTGFETNARRFVWGDYKINRPSKLSVRVFLRAITIISLE